MVCRSTPGNSAITTMARNTSNLHDVQVLSLFHETRSEAPRTTAAPTVAERARFLRDHSTFVTNNYPDMPERRRRDLLNRIQEARETDVDGRTYYAWQNIEQRAMFARSAMESHFSAIARRHGYSPAIVESAFNDLMRREHRVGDAVPEAPEHVPFATTHLPRDRGTRYALAMLHASGPQVTTDPALAIEVYEGIHADSARLAANPETNPANQCPDCGQFAGDNHVCPHVEAMNQSYSQWISEETPASNEVPTSAGGLPTDRYSLTTLQSAPYVAYRTLDYPGLRENVDALTRHDENRWEATDGTIHRSRVEGARHQRAVSAEATLRSEVGSLLGHPAASNEVSRAITNTREQLARRDDGSYLTSDNRAFSRDVDAVYHELNHDSFDGPVDLVAINEHGRSVTQCAQCGQFADAGHVCLSTLMEQEDAAAAAALAAWEAELVEQAAAEELQRQRAELGSNLTQGEGLNPDGEYEHPVFTDAERAAADFAAMTEPERAAAARYLRSSREGNPTAPYEQWEDDLLSGRTAEGDNAILRQARLDAERGTGDGLTDEQRTRRYARIVRDSDPNRPLDPWEAELLTGDAERAVQAASEDAAEAAANAPTPPVRRRNPLRNYTTPDDNVQVRMMNLSSIRATPVGEAQELDTVEVTLPTEFDDNGNAQTISVTGTVTVINTGQRRTRTRDRYDVTARSSSLRCTCPQYREMYDCPHINQAGNTISAFINDRDAVAVAPVAAMNHVGAELRDEYDASLASAQEARAEFDAAVTEDISYGDNMAAFQSAWDEAKAHFESGDQTLPYMYENATNGLGTRETGRSIGIEIEVDFPQDMNYTAKAAVAREIYEAGLSDSPEVRPWHWRARSVGHRGQPMGGGYTDNPNMWSVEHDSSVDDVGGRRGCEIVSPILYDTPETWRNLEKICEIVQRHGGAVTPRTGLHINIGAADFDHTVGNHNRLIGLANAYEDVIVRSAHNPASGPNHRGRDYCRPMTMPEEGFSSIRQAQRSIDPQNYEGSSHRAMINLDHVPAEGAPVQNSTRVEVRIFDGAIDPGRIQANVNMSLGMVNAAVRGVDVPRDQERAGTHRSTNAGANGRMRRLRGEAWENDTASFRKFADTLFATPEHKKQMTYAFAASRWQRR